MKSIEFIFPIDGDFLGKSDVYADGGILFTEVIISSEKEKKLTVNGVEASAINGLYKASVQICEGKNTFSISCDGRVCEEIHAYYIPEANKKFRISTDDNILFLRNINGKKDEYTSIFNDPYLSVYKKAHDLYGACVDVNLFYETDDMPGFSHKGEYFNLSMMTDKFKDEWEENSDWLRLSFHANAEHPAKPYMSAEYHKIYDDALKVNKEIIRFAGRKSLSSTATVHWGEATREGTLAMKALGYNTLAGYFEISDSGTPRVAYYYPNELIRHIGARDLWKNHDTDILHARIDLVLNVIKYGELEQKLTEIYRDPHRSGFIEIMIHEQYFYPEYKNYIPEFSQMVIEAAGWLHAHGYTGTFTDKITSRL